MSGKRSRDKGSRGELEAFAALGEMLGVMLERNLQQSRQGGSDCVKLKGFSVEVKRQERLARQTWWRQAVKQADIELAEPMVLYRKNRKPWMALICKADRDYREATLEEAASHIREKWLCWP